jgi:hypothetical protein
MRSDAKKLWKEYLKTTAILPLRAFRHLVALLPHLAFAAMSKDDEKQGSSTDVTVEETLFYDPSKESRWTRLGLTLESFKRAPGTTAYVII